MLKRKAKLDCASIPRLPVSPTSKQCCQISLIKVVNSQGRSDFEEEGLKSAKERLERLEGMIKTERANLSKLEEQNAAAAEDIAVAEQGIAKLKEELSTVQAVLEEKTRVVDQVKKTTSKASKVLDQALKEIATAVSCPFFLAFIRLTFSTERRNREACT